jgi:hypothetical protein
LPVDGPDMLEHSARRFHPVVASKWKGRYQLTKFGRMRTSIQRATKGRRCARFESGPSATHLVPDLLARGRKFRIAPKGHRWLSCIGRLVR